jgi:hypothetical protein
MLRGVVLGLLAGSLAGIGLGVWRAVPGHAVSWWVGLGVLLAGPVLGLLAGALWRRHWHEAATAVDATYGLKDRIATALDFLTRHLPTPLHELQVADAEEHLAAVKPREVVPLRLPRTFPYAVGALLVAVALLAWPLGSKPVVARPTAPLPAIVDEANQIGEDLKALDELARSEKNKELRKLVDQLKQKVEEMKQPGVDEREALAKLSEMQAAITAQQAQFNVGLVDGQLQSLGEAMVPAEALEAAGQALQEGKYEKAAKELENLENPELDRKETKAVTEKMKQVAKEMGEAGLGQMSEAATEMADGLNGGNKGKFKKGSKTMAGLARSQGTRRKIKEILDAELASLDESKGKCQGDKTARVRKPEKSLTPKSDWGAGISGNVFGEKTNPDSKRELKEITGNPGDGPSEVETTHSPEGRQLAARGYKENYNKYRKMSESVLDSEPIPLGHRQTIRKYFELIRPQNLEGEKDAPGAN